MYLLIKSLFVSFLIDSLKFAIATWFQLNNSSLIEARDIDTKLYNTELPGALFSIQARKIKKKSTQRKCNFLTLILRNFLYFLKRKLFLYLGKGNPEKTSYNFSKEGFSYISGKGNSEKNPYISGNGNSKKLLIFQEVTSRAQKIKNPTLKKLLIFWEMELSSPKKLNKTFLCS